MELHELSVDKVSKDNLYRFLTEKRLSNHYDDIHLLHHIITGKPCADFSQFEGVLLEYFELQEKALDEITTADKKIGRTNSINVYYKLYKLLQKVGWECKKGDFYILKTKTKEDEHDEKMKKAWFKLGWTWIDTF
jgi:hypothetical protein